MDIQARGLCRMHYMRERRGQRLDTAPRYGGVVKYQMAHRRVKAAWGSASQYACCGCGNFAREWAYDGTDSSALEEFCDGSLIRYSIHPEFYMPMCVPCHRNFDIERHDRRRKPCGVDGCSRPCHARDLCGSHYVMHRREEVQNH